MSIDLQISPDYRDPYDSEMDESDEDALLGDFELEDSKSITDESDESDWVFVNNLFFYIFNMVSKCRY